jgi:NAD(P)-dependent dehydrogenase (short-subunit alcohol dehydrogenase family)
MTAVAAPPLLSGKIALVTGAGDELGRAIALRYAREGAKVVLSDTNDRTGRQTFEQLRSSGGEGIYIHAGARRAQHHRALLRAVADAYGRLDVACNSAGVTTAGGSIGGRNEFRWPDQVDLDLSGLFSGVRVQLESMLSTGGGVIVNVASILDGGGSVREEAVLYTAAKLVSLTKIVTREYGNRGIRVNTVGPAFSARRLPPSTLKADEVAALIAWLSSDQSNFVTGAYYPIDYN